jgi:hypothetical protein
VTIGRLADSRANEIAGNRVLAARGSIYLAFDNLGCGIDHDQALEFLAGSPHFQALDERQRGLVAGIVMGFAIVAVESEREVRSFGRRRWFGR